MPRTRSRLLLVSFALAACDRPEAASGPAAGSAVATPMPAVTQARAEVPRAPIEVPSAVPLEASAVLVIRVPDSLFSAIASVDILGVTSEGLDDLRTELDAYFERRAGVRILGARAAAAFALGKQDFGAVLVGVEGDIKARAAGSHEGVALHEADELLLARIDDMLVIGSEAAVKAAITAAKDEAKSARGGGLGPMLKAHSHGASLAAAVDFTRVPEDLAHEIPPQFRVARALATFGSDGVRLRVEGTPSQLEALSKLVDSGLAAMVATAESQHRAALESDGPIAQGAAAIFALHYAKGAQKRLVPRLEDGALTIELPVKVGDAGMVAALVGMGAAIAIPAFTKYMRRSKTSEARVQLAKMFDATSAYFNEEHVERPSEADPLAGLTGAVHRCPNDGSDEGHAGVTPPLAVDCSRGPAGRCFPTAGASDEPGTYDAKLWTDNPVWNGLNFQQEQAHAFHYDFRWKNGASGSGTCQFTAQAFGDLDGDGLFSTFERSGAADHLGVNVAVGLYIDQEIE